MVGLVQLDGADAVQRLIRITDGQKAALRAWALEEPMLAARITESVRYRERVLAEFNALVGNKS